MFKAKEFVGALEAPSFEDLDGVVHVGRLLSHLEMSAHYDRLRGAYDGLDLDPHGVVKVMFAACETMFDAPAVEALKKMPGPAVEAAIIDFFASHRQSPKTAA